MNLVDTLHFVLSLLVQWLKLLAWKVEDRRFEPRSGIQVLKKQYGSSPLTLKDNILPQTHHFSFIFIMKALPLAYCHMAPYRSPATNKMILPRSLVKIQYCVEPP